MLLAIYSVAEIVYNNYKTCCYSLGVSKLKVTNSAKLWILFITLLKWIVHLKIIIYSPFFPFTHHQNIIFCVPMKKRFLVEPSL